MAGYSSQKPHFLLGTAPDGVGGGRGGAALAERGGDAELESGAAVFNPVAGGEATSPEGKVVVGKAGPGEAPPADTGGGPGGNAEGEVSAM